MANPAWPWVFPKEVGVNDFEGITQGQEPSAYQIEELHKAALHFASFVIISKVFFTCESFTSLAADQQESLTCACACGI